MSDIDIITVEGYRWWENNVPSKIAILAFIHSHGDRVRSIDLTNASITEPGIYGIHKDAMYKVKKVLRDEHAISVTNGTKSGSQSTVRLTSWDRYKPAVEELLAHREVIPILAIPRHNSRQLPTLDIVDDRELHHLQRIIKLLISKLSIDDVAEILMEVNRAD